MKKTFVVSVLCLCSIALHAQSTMDEIKARLVDKPLYLAGQWGSDSLSFDATGKAIHPPNPVTFTLSGAEIKDVRIKGHKLILSGNRVGIEFSPDGMKRVPLILHDRFGPNEHPEELKIEIDEPPNGDYTNILDNIFFVSLEQFVPQLPPYWKTYGRRLRPKSPGDAPAQETGPKPFSIGGTVLPPRLIKNADATYTDAARVLRYSGEVLVSLVVDSNGKPTNLQVLRPLGLGLDEAALTAVNAYVFQPATKDGVGVPVDMNVAVNFQIFVTPAR